MEANTVLLSLDRYHQLQVAEKKNNKPKNNSIYVKNYYSWGCYTDNTQTSSETLFTDDDTVAELGNELKAVLENVDKLQNEVNCYKMLYPEEQPISIDTIKRMSVFQFLKWKRKNK